MICVVDAEAESFFDRSGGWLASGIGHFQDAGPSSSAALPIRCDGDDGAGKGWIGAPGVRLSALGQVCEIRFSKIFGENARKEVHDERDAHVRDG